MSNDNILVNNPTCHACPVACKKEVEVKEGPYKGLRMESVEYESAWALGANCGNDDINAVVKLIDQCNDYGMDRLNWAMSSRCTWNARKKGTPTATASWLGAT